MNGIIDAALTNIAASESVWKLIDESMDHCPAPVMVAALRTRSVGILTCYG